MRLPPAAVTALLAPLLLIASTGQPGVLWGEWLLGAGTADVWGHLWGYAWTVEALGDGRLPLHDAPLAHPAGQSWWIIDLPVALALAPVTALFGPSVAYNLAILAPVSAGAAGLTAWLTRRGVRPAHAAVAGLLVALGPFSRGAVTSGVPEALVVLWMPLFALALERALDPESRRRAVAVAGLAAATIVLDGAYGALVGGLVGLAVAGVAAARAPGRRAAVLGRAAAVAAPALAAVLLVRWGLDLTAHPALAEDPRLEPNSLPWWPLQALGGADLASFVVPWPALPEFPRPGSAHVHAVYVGAPLLVAAAAAVRHRPARPLVALAVAAGVLALGPVARWWGQGVGLLPPGQLLTALGAHNLYRVAGLVPLAAVAAVALAFGRGRARGLWVLWGVVLVDQATLSPLRGGTPAVADPVGVVEAGLADAEVPGAVVDLPFEREGTSARGPVPQQSLRRQAVHGRPIASGLYRPAMGGDVPPALKALDHAVAATRRQERGEARGRKQPQAPAPLSGRECDGLHAQLSERSFGWLTVDRGAVPERIRDDVEAWVRACFGAPAIDGGRRAAWQVRRR